MKDDIKFLQLWDTYSPMLTATQREITDLYFNYDLSLGEIAEQKGVSRQSVSDCLNKCRKQLEKYEEKLGFLKALEELSLEYSAYMTTVGRWAERTKKSCPEMADKINDLQTQLDEVHKQFGVEKEAMDEENEIVGKVY
ncbi:MAG: putative DNA-binding protein [Clostridiales bacterium]|nr:putative DNA-binding protein [Clostridiales bacterium]